MAAWSWSKRTALAAPCYLALLLACGDSSRGGSDDNDGDGGAGLTGTGSGAGTSGSGAGPGGGCDIDGITHTGEGTYYDADGSGNCSFPATPDNLMVAAMNAVDYAASAACGACITVDGPDGSVTVRIVDQCPGCPEGDVDMSPQAFELIAPLEAGRVPITWRYVACGLNGPIVYHFKDGSNPFWTAVQIRNHRYPVAKVEYRNGNSGYSEMLRESYNYFIAEQMGEGPFTFRVTDVLGQQLEDSGIPLLDNAEAPGAAQFPECTGM